MKQLIQSRKATTIEVPAPVCRDGHILVKNCYSLVSRGTEKNAIQFARKSLLGKAKSRPDLVARVVEKARRDGLMSAYDTVRGHLGTGLALGYSSAGHVIQVGSGAEGFQVSDRVACAGSGYAVHAEVISVPINLAAVVPAGVSLEEASFVTIGAIAVQAVRTAELRLGESVLVIGLGLIGLTLVQVLKSAGCRVAGIDPVTSRCALARELACDLTSVDSRDIERQLVDWTGGGGVDAAIIAASSPDNQPVELAARVCRHGGMVVVVGAVGMNLPRRPFYEKELTFRVSRSYGPGRYDPEYEEKGRDYPFAYVRWTEKRNMESFLELLRAGKVTTRPLISHRFPIDQAADAYGLISEDSHQASLGVLLSYPEDYSAKYRLDLRTPPTRKSSGRISVGLLGAGNFARSVLIPELQRLPEVELVGLCSGTGLGAREAAERFGFRFCTTSEDEIWNDGEIDLVVIATRHHLHARQLISSLRAGKHVFCEKPLCLNLEELSSIVALQQEFGRQNLAPMIMVGFNRRFSPMICEIKEHLRDNSSWMLQLRVNAGSIPAEHWIHDPDQGGGRIIGEVCHFVDLFSYLVGESAGSVLAVAASSGRSGHLEENLSVRLTYPGGSVATLTYAASGDPAIGKEYLEMFGGRTSIQLDDYRKLTLRQNGRRKTRRAILRRNRGHRHALEVMMQRICQGGPAPISFQELVDSTLTTFAIKISLASGEEVRLDWMRAQLAERVNSSSYGNSGGREAPPSTEKS